MTYTRGDERTVLELRGDPFAICNAVRERLFPLEPLPERDARFDAVIRARKKRDE